MEIQFKQYFSEGQYWAELHVGDKCVFEAKANSMQEAFNACDTELKETTGLSYLEKAA